MTSNKMAPFARTRIWGPENGWIEASIHLRTAVGKRLRRFFLRHLLRYYASCVARAFDRQASSRLDAITFLLESEGEDES